MLTQFVNQRIATRPFVSRPLFLLGLASSFFGFLHSSPRCLAQRAEGAVADGHAPRFVQDRKWPFFLRNELLIPEFGDDLQLTPEQRKRHRLLVEDLDAAVQKLEAVGNGQRDGASDSQDVERQEKELRATFAARIWTEILLEHQRRRVEQLYVQQAAGNELLDVRRIWPLVLGNDHRLNGEQVAAVDAIYDHEHEQLVEIGRKASDECHEVSERLQEKIMAVLTPAQARLIEDLHGEPDTSKRIPVDQFTMLVIAMKKEFERQQLESKAFEASERAGK